MVGVGGCWWEWEGAGVVGVCWCGGSGRVLVWWECAGVVGVGGCWCGECAGVVGVCTTHWI